MTFYQWKQAMKKVSRIDLGKYIVSLTTVLEWEAFAEEFPELRLVLGGLETEAVSRDEGEKDQPLRMGSPMHKRLEASLNEEGVDRDEFKEYLNAKGYMDGGSMRDLTVGETKRILDNFEVLIEGYHFCIGKHSRKQRPF